MDSIKPLPYILFQLKSDLNLDDCIQLINKISENGVRKFRRFYVALPLLRLQEMGQQFQDSGITFGVSQLNRAHSKAFTASLATSIVTKFKGQFTLIGSEEERTILSLSDEELADKLLAAKENHLKVIYCFGASKKRLEDTELDQQLELLKQSQCFVEDPHPLVIFSIPFSEFKEYLPSEEELVEFYNQAKASLARVFGEESHQISILASLPNDLSGFSKLLNAMPFEGAFFTKASVYPHVLHEEAVTLVRVNCEEKDEINSNRDLSIES